MDRRSFLTAGTIGGSIALSGCLAQLPTATDSTRSRSTGDPALSVVKATGSLADSEAVHSGWAHLVADGDGYDMTFDARICHGPDVGVDASLADTGAGTFEVALSKTSPTVDSEASTSQTDRSGCGRGTRIRGSATLPTDLHTLTFTAGGRQVLDFEKEGTVGEMRPLPDPISEL